jgi:hypothetical protein
MCTYGTAGMSTMTLNFLPLSAADRIRWAIAMPDVSDVSMDNRICLAEPRLTDQIPNQPVLAASGNTDETQWHIEVSVAEELTL